MTELAKQLGFTLKPFCVRTEDFTEQEIADLLDRCVDLGAEAEEGYEGLNTYHRFNDTSYTYEEFLYTGVDADLVTWIEDDLNCYHNNYLTKEEALVYLQLAPQDGLLVGNETLEPVLEDGFIPWSGGECPVPKGTIVHVKYRDRSESIVTALLWRDDPNYRRVSGESDAVDWNHGSFAGDIVAYKVYKEPVEENTSPQDEGEGWIENTGVMPVDGDVLVDVDFGECISSGLSAGAYSWETYQNCFSDIKSWRPHKPPVSSVEESSTETNTNTKGSELEAPMQAPVSMIKGVKVEGNIERLFQLILGNLEGDMVLKREGLYVVGNSDYLGEALGYIEDSLPNIELYILSSELDKEMLDKDIEEAQNTLNDLIKRREELNK